MRLLRDREEGVVVGNKEEYVEALLDTLQDRLEVLSYQRTKKDKKAPPKKKKKEPPFPLPEWAEELDDVIKKYKEME